MLIKARSIDLSRCPFLKINCPAFTSSPANRVLLYLFKFPSIQRLSPRILESSFRTTVSTPSGKLAPVSTLIACPSRTFPKNGSPAAERPFRIRYLVVPTEISLDNPYPSTAELFT